ncbi:proline rich transmembrane protein 1B-like isoform X1 [Watersipora subatra]|uniref:proline rich transmembrane protein 1B-like isoform X1 n=1 Tax=Watersipora subatra TaxID=2589382 RepID=UPI00355AEEBC
MAQTDSHHNPMEKSLPVDSKSASADDQGYPTQLSALEYSEFSAAEGYPQQPVAQGYPQQPVAPGYPQQPVAPGYPQPPVAPGYPQQPVAPAYPTNQVFYTPLTNPPNDYLALSIFTTIFCCFWIGIVAIYKSTKVRDLATKGDATAAAEASQTARVLNIVGIICGIITITGLSVYLYFAYDSVIY